MIKIDVAVSDNDKNWSKGIDDGGTRDTIADADSDTDSTGVRCLLLEFLPRELLTQSILASYLDGKSLANFWCAAMSKQEMVIRRNSPKGNSRNSPLSQPSMVEEIFQIIQRRRAVLLEEEGHQTTVDNEHYCLRRQVFQAFEEAISTQSPSDATNGGDASQAKNTGGNDEIVEQKGSEIRGNNDPFFNFDGFLTFSRRIFGNLLAMDYCERVPQNLVWCGFLRVDCGFLRIHENQFGGTNLQGNDLEPIKVALVVHPRRRSMKEIRLWRNATTSSLSSCTGIASRSVEESQKQPTMKANVIPHNFLPVGPTRGRLVGLTESDRRSLRKISDGLNRSEMVGRFSCVTASVVDRNTGRNNGGQFTVKLTSFAQAQRKLNTVFRNGYEPGGIPLSDEKESMVLHSLGGANCNGNCNEDHDHNSLLCCWNHEFLWEDSRSFRLETSYALRDTMNEYDRLVVQQ